MILRTAAMCLASLLAYAAVAGAQTAPPEYRRGQVTFAGGLTAATSYGIGDTTTDLRRNAPGAATSVPFFRTESEVGSAAAIDGRVSIGLTPTIAVEVAGAYAQPHVNVRITGDLEAGGEASAAEQVEQYTVDVSALILLPDLGFGQRARPYALAGGGYLRQLHEGRLQAETGHTLFAGGGIQFWMRGAANRRQHPVGLRGEARFIHRSGGIDYEEKSRHFVAVSALLFVGF